METSNILDVQENEQAQVMTVKDWLLTFLIGMIPLINLIMLIVWALSSDGNPNRQNFAKASLLFSVLIIALFFLLSLSAVSLLSSF